MQIFAEPVGEKNFFEPFPNLPVCYVPGLEEMTGADFVISPLDLPWVPVFYQKIIDSGAAFVQRKSGTDLPSSIPDRLNSSLARMLSLPNIKQSQCVLLFIGVLLEDADRNVTIDYRKVNQYGENVYWMIKGALAKWLGRGGVVEDIQKKSQFPEWAMMKARHANEFQMEPIKYVYAEKPTLTALPLQDGKSSKPTDPFQELVSVKDWRNTLLTMPGMGPSKVQALYEMLKSHIECLQDGETPHLTDALIMLTNYKLSKQNKVVGIGPGIVESQRRWLGIPDGWDLDLVPSEEK